MPDCSDCTELGQQVVATRQLPSKRFVCDQHWRSRMGMQGGLSPQTTQTPKEPAAAREPQAAAKAGTKNMIDTATIEGIKRDAAANMPLQEIADKHQVSYPTAKKYAASAAVSGKPKVARHRPARPEDEFDYSEMLVQARMKRKSLEDQLDRLIDFIKALEKLTGKG